MGSFLENVSRWQQKADDGEIKYYKAPASAQDVYMGQTPLVLGRKGSGKTALINYIEDTYANESFFVRLTFNPVLLKGWGRRAAERALSAHEYEILWTAFIFQTVCREAVRRNILRGAAKDEISIRHGVDSHSSIMKSIRRLAQTVTSLKVTFSGVEVEKGFAPDKLPQYRNENEWMSFIDVCKDDVRRIADTSEKRCIVLCDEIDLRFDPNHDPMLFDDYVNCIKGLLLSAAQLAIGRGKEPVSPIIALRSDIFDALSGPELNAWNGRTLRLEPDEEALRDVLRYRISRALPDSRDQKVLGFREAWRRAFTENATGMPTESVDSDSNLPNSYAVISLRTLSRVRDYVEFMRLAAKHQIAMGKDRKTISPAALTAAYTDFAVFLLDEFRDELYFKYSFGHLIVESFRALYLSVPERQNFQFSDWTRALRDQGVSIDDLKARELAKDLYRMSIIGFQTRGPTNWTKATFRYQSEVLQLPPSFWGADVALTLHRGFRRALTPST